MMLGMSLASFTALHVALALVGIAAGVVAVAGLARGRLRRGWTALFLATTVLTSVTGFLLPFTAFLPSHAFGIVSLVVLAGAIAALHPFRLVGHARWIYVVGATIALYLNAFVGVVQAFLKIPALHALAPTQGEPAFAAAQGAVLVLFVALGAVAVRGFRPARPA
jgi:hypothetical protein